MLSVRFESTYANVAPLTVDVDGADDERIARAVALEALAKAGKPITYRRLDNVEFSFANLTGAVFRSCSFPGAKFSGTDLTHTTFSGCDFSGIDRGGGTADPANFDADANLTNAVLVSCNCEGVDFGGAKLEGAEFNGTNLRRADMRGVKAQGAKFYRCRTGGSSWTGADMRWSLCYGLERATDLLLQFDGNDADRCALVWFQDLFRQIGSPAVPSVDAAKACAIAAAEKTCGCLTT
ncbi:pentapeptide repeat-containing protein [uncultured Pseudacidovorax sp.]|uniref:pentapeptide repeat-containing protein n=1 Tax=uncultured Pseudacidovorax sp. TaxID=679313 RepID=UPI0025CBF4B0|nr:pentapeptide repeat-containing protein [uncultured Pseudacidovorax sp.]